MSEWYPEGAWIGLFTYPSGRSAANTVFNGLSTWDFRDLRFHPFQTCESMKARSMDKRSGMAYWISLGIFYIFWDAPPLFSRLKWIQEKTRLGAYTSHFLVTGSHERCTNNAPLPGKLAVSPREIFLEKNVGPPRSKSPSLSFEAARFFGSLAVTDVWPGWDGRFLSLETAMICGVAWDAVKVVQKHVFRPSGSFFFSVFENDTT